jgi:hypothetical protein
MASSSHSKGDSVGEKPSTEFPNPRGNGLHLYPQQDRRFGSMDNMARRNYGDPISRMRSDDDFTLHEGVSSKDSYPSLKTKDSKAQLTKEETRRRIKQKHKSKIPGHVKWTKWMHTESKNRRSSATNKE